MIAANSSGERSYQKVSFTTFPLRNKNLSSVNANLLSLKKNYWKLMLTTKTTVISFLLKTGGTDTVFYWFNSKIDGIIQTRYSSI